MKSAIGYYYNLYSDNDSDNYGLKLKFDITIVFIESFGVPDMSDVFGSLELLLEGRLKYLGMTKPFARKADIEKVVRETLNALDYEYQNIFISEALTYDGLMVKTAI